jgi:hypothetical protein
VADTLRAERPGGRDPVTESGRKIRVACNETISSSRCGTVKAQRPRIHVSPNARACEVAGATAQIRPDALIAAVRSL